MACIKPDGTLTETAQAVIAAVGEATAPEEVASQTLLRLYHVRSVLRELAGAGLVEERDGRYSITAAGRAKPA